MGLIGLMGLISLISLIGLISNSHISIIILYGI